MVIVDESIAFDIVDDGKDPRKVAGFIQGTWNPSHPKGDGRDESLRSIPARFEQFTPTRLTIILLSGIILRRQQKVSLPTKKGEKKREEAAEDEFEEKSEDEAETEDEEEDLDEEEEEGDNRST